MNNIEEIGLKPNIKFIISRGRNTESASCEFVENNTREEIFNSYISGKSYEMDEVVYESTNEAAARQAFAERCSTMNITKTGSGYEITYDLYELTVCIDDEVISSEIASL